MAWPSCFIHGIRKKQPAVDQGKVLRSCGGELCAGKLWRLAALFLLRTGVLVTQCQWPRRVGRTLQRLGGAHPLSSAIVSSALNRRHQRPGTGDPELSQTLVCGALAPRDWANRPQCHPLSVRLCSLRGSVSADGAP